MASVAARAPPDVGMNVTWKVVEAPAAMEVEGIAVTLKSPAAAPLIAMYGEAARQRQGFGPRIADGECPGQ